jgi:oxygen-independent coproporphyrinogen III oxidase
MPFGIYIHIPYCLQRCTYCDFATYVHSEIMPSNNYISLIKKEIDVRASSWKQNNQAERPLTSIYFGGGTPSLLPAHEIVSIISWIEKAGFSCGPETEITIEINPATVSEEKLIAYLKAGINRFSVGAQSFDDALLKSVNREHNSEQTRETLRLLKSYNVNYSFDLLFGLPKQRLDQLKVDLDHVLGFRPPHISPYYLTVPEGHVLSKNRPEEDVQIEMFEMISNTLCQAGYNLYEISNLSLPGFESKHNELYWQDEEYWGIGLSAHSYSKKQRWGERFWNATSIKAYENQVEKMQESVWRTPYEGLDQNQVEILQPHQSLTDFCHISLRRTVGMSRAQLTAKFGEKMTTNVEQLLLPLIGRGLVETSDANSWRLTAKGRLVSNQVFQDLTFLAQDFSP